MKGLVALVVAASCGGAFGQQNIVRIVPDRATVRVGETVSYSVIADVTSPTGFDIIGYNIRVESDGAAIGFDASGVGRVSPLDFIQTVFSAQGALFEVSGGSNAFVFDFAPSGATLFTFEVVAQEEGVIGLSLDIGTVDGSYGPVLYGEPTAIFLRPISYTDIEFVDSTVRVVPTPGVGVVCGLGGAWMMRRRRAGS